MLNLSLQHHRLVSSIIIPVLLRRYAEFAAAIVGINETFPHEQMNRLLAVLQEEVTEKKNEIAMLLLYCDFSIVLQLNKRWRV